MKKERALEIAENLMDYIVDTHELQGALEVFKRLGIKEEEVESFGYGYLEGEK